MSKLVKRQFIFFKNPASYKQRNKQSKYIFIWLCRQRRVYNRWSNRQCFFNRQVTMDQLICFFVAVSLFYWLWTLVFTVKITRIITNILLHIYTYLICFCPKWYNEYQIKALTDNPRAVFLAEVLNRNEMFLNYI